VHLLGERQDLDRIFGAMDLFIHPSLTEGLGSSILDAFAAGVPVVASRTGGIPELVEDRETGRLVAPGDPAALARGIVAMLDDFALAASMAARARQQYERHFTDAAMARASLIHYRALLAQ
jgi:glycosyltransferase involved in cell wall biosynthesis